MESAEIEDLHDRAARHYAEGRYDEARRSWERILEAVPAEPRAAEGLRLLSLLPSGGISDEGLESLAAPADPALETEIVRAEELLIAGSYREALESLEILRELYPDSQEVRWLEGRARARFEAEPFLALETEAAKRAWRRGDEAALREACAHILAVEPDHGLAVGLMEASGFASKAVWSEDRLAPLPDEESMIATPVLAQAPASIAAPQAFAAAPREPERPEREPEPEPVESPEPTLRPAEDSASGSLFEMDVEGTEALPLQTQPPPSPETSFEGAGANFAVLEEEIDETLSMEPQAAAHAGGAPDASGFPEGSETHAPPGAPEDFSAPSDLAFSDDAAPAEEDSSSSWFTESSFAEAAEPPPPAAPSWMDQSIDPRIRTFLEEAQAAIDAGRYSQAIETASRAFAIDAEAAGAQDLIDLARARLDEVDRQSEEHLYHAQKSLEEGDDAAAEALLREVLRTHPGHREAVELLASMSRPKDGAAPEAESWAPSLQRVEPVRRADLELEAPALDRGDRASSFPPPEPLKPRPGSEQEFEGSALPIPPVSTAAVAKKVSGPSFYRFVFYAVLALLLIGGSVLGLRVLPKFFIGPETPQVSPPSERRPARKEVINVRQPEMPGGATAPLTPAPSPVQSGSATGLSPEVPRTLEQARAFVAEGKLEEARAVLNDVVANEPGNRQAFDLRNSVLAKAHEQEQRAQALASIENAFKQERYEDALRLLYRLAPEMQKGDVETKKRNAWYNNGLVFMSGGNGTEAMRCFKEALDIDPRDQDARHLVQFIQGYQGREKDSAYFRYAESLPKRQFDDR